MKNLKKYTTGALLTDCLVVIAMIAVIASIVIISITTKKVETPHPLGVTAVEPMARIATSSTIQVGPQQVKTIFSSDTFCAGRLIGTNQVGLTLSFSSAVIPSATVGYPVNASSTTAFLSRTYGCGPVTVFATASTTITISESLF